MEYWRFELSELITRAGGPPRFMTMRRAQMRHSKLTLTVMLDWCPSAEPLVEGVPYFDIVCTKAVDYALRPRDPNCTEGGPLAEYYEKHPKLDHPALQDVPGGDGEMFDPPIHFKLLILDQTYVIAEKFEIRPTSAPDLPSQG